MAHIHRLVDGSETGPAIKKGDGHIHVIPDGPVPTSISEGMNAPNHVHTYSGGRTGPPLDDQIDSMD